MFGYSFEEFEREIINSERLYFNDSKRPISKILDNQNQILYQDLYNSLIKVPNRYDRLNIIFKYLDIVKKKDIDKVKFANRLLIDRYTFQSFEIIKSINLQIDSNIDIIEYFQVYAKILICLSRFDEALQMASSAYAIDKENIETKLLCADSMYLSGEKEEALKLYHRYFEKITNNINETDYKNYIVEMFGFDNKSIYSPVAAVIYLNNQGFNDDMWKECENIYYYNPYFRYEYSKKLIVQNRLNEGFSKLVKLIIEMNWYEKAAVYAMEIFNLIDPDENKGVLAKEREYIKKLIKNNNWIRN